MGSPVNTFPELAPIIGQIINLQPAGAQFKSPPTWVSSDNTVFQPTVSADGLSCTGELLKTGSCNVTVTGDNGVSQTVPLGGVAGSPVSFQVVFSLAPPAPPASVVQ